STSAARVRWRLRLSGLTMPRDYTTVLNTDSILWRAAVDFRSVQAGLLALAMLAAPAASQAQRLAPGQPIPPAELEAYVDALVEPAMDRDHIAGVVVSVV